MSVEARADDLEKRVTDISFDVARKTMKMMAYETHFDDIMKCTRLEEVRDKVYNLRFIAGQSRTQQSRSSCFGTSIQKSQVLVKIQRFFYLHYYFLVTINFFNIQSKEANAKIVLSWRQDSAIFQFIIF